MDALVKRRCIAGVRKSLYERALGSGLEAMFAVALEGANEVFASEVVVRVVMLVWCKEGKEKVSRGTRLGRRESV